MSLSTFLTSTASIERQTGGVDASGATVSGPFVAVTGSTALACAVWPRAANPFQAMAQFAIKGDYVLAFAANPSASPGDRVNVGGVYYLVSGLQVFSSPVVTSETLYLVYADLWIKR